MIDVIALGETIVDLTGAGRSENGQRLFEENAGGAASIVAATAARMGVDSMLIGKVGANSFGDFLESTMRAYQVSTAGMVFDPDAFTTLCFVDLDENGRPRYAFVRKPGADTQLEIGELPLEMLDQCGVLHISGLALTDEPIRSAATVAVQVARESGVMVSLDPNYRNDLWVSKEAFKARTLNALNKVDVVVMDLEEMTILTGEVRPDAASERLLSKGLSIVVIRMGMDGTYVRTREGEVVVSSPKLNPIDLTGAGAIFIGTFLASLSRSAAKLETPLVTLKDYVLLGNAASALSTTVRGGTPSIPTEAAVHDLLMNAPEN